MNIVELVRKQVQGCKELLGVFQKERQLYQTSSSVSQEVIMGFLKKKEELVGVFDQQKEIQRQAVESGESGKDEYKFNLRELAGLLEQLLVIDQENEKLLRNLLSQSGRPACRERSLPLGCATSVPRPRPALMQQLPFFPGMAARPQTMSRPLTAVAAPQAAQASTPPPAAPAGLRRAPSSQLRQYSSAASLTVRYA